MTLGGTKLPDCKMSEKQQITIENNVPIEQESDSRFPQFLVKISTDYIEKFSMVYECKPANCDTNARRQHSPREPQHRDIEVDPKPPTPNNRPYIRKWPIAALSRQCNLGMQFPLSN
jgi:hypothetical protein